MGMPFTLLFNHADPFSNHTAVEKGLMGSEHYAPAKGLKGFKYVKYAQTTVKFANVMGQEGWSRNPYKSMRDNAKISQANDGAPTRRLWTCNLDYIIHIDP